MGASAFDGAGDRNTPRRFVIQAWQRDRAVSTWKREGDVAECNVPEAVGVALVTLTDDGEWTDDRKAAVWDREEGRYLGGPPW